MPELTWTLPVGHQAVTAVAQTPVNASDVTAVQRVDAGATGAPEAVTSVSVAKGSLGLSLVFRPREGTGTDPDPGPAPDPTPSTDWRYAQIGTSQQLAITSINPTSTTYPGGRGPNELVAYRDPVTATVTNEWGTEVAVSSSNVVTAVYDRQASGSASGTAVPSGGYVLSGHGTARSWLNTWATVGATVALTTGGNPDPTPGDPGTPGDGYPVKAVAVYKKVWSSSSPVTNVPSAANEIRISFAQGSPPALTGYTSAGQSSFVSSLAARRAAGARIVVSIGGAGGGISTSARSEFLQGIANIKTILQGSSGGGLDGIDWDIEASSLNRSDVVWISTQLKQTYGSTFAITMAPNGGNVGQYLPCAVELHNAGALDHYAQQFYDASVSLSAAKGRITEAIGAGIPQSKMGVGMMLGDDSRHWSNAKCRTYMSDIRATWPGITKCYLWTEDDQLSSGIVSTWVSDMRSIIGF